VTDSFAPEPGAKQARHLLAQVVGREIRRVDQDRSAAFERAQQVTIPRDAVGGVVVGRQWMAPAGFGIAPLQRYGIAVEIKQIRLQSG
jgi:hypothetical protein